MMSVCAMNMNNMSLDMNEIWFLLILLCELYQNSGLVALLGSLILLFIV